MKTETRNPLRSFLIELFAYAAVVVVYFYLVLRFLGGWLVELFLHERRLYAVAALMLIICQGVLLEILTRVLLDFIRVRTED